jgi:hypothetical protein
MHAPVVRSVLLARLAVAGLPVLVALASRPAPLHAQAQASTAVVRGVVTDSSGAPLAEAQVTLRNLETNAQRTLATNARGVYVASLLRVGTYDISARRLGFQPAERHDVRLGLGETAVVDFQLRPRVVQLEEVAVRGAGPVAEPERVAAATRLDTAAVQGLPNNGRNFLNLTLLTPNVGVVQGPDGDELSIGGQRGIHNNVSVDGADFNNPFFGEQRGGQRPAFTFNLDAVQEVVVVSQGANAEFGRSGGGFVNVITKSGTNELHGTAHYFGKYDQLSADFTHTTPSGVTSGFAPDFRQHQFGGTLGGPIIRDRAFFFLAYDQQIYRDTKQTTRLGLIDPKLVAWTDTAYAGALRGEFGSIQRTNDANAFLAKFDAILSPRHTASLKYNYTNSRQENGTFDVDLWGRSANGLERDYSHAINGLLASTLSSSTSNEFRFQWAREDRPRPYDGPDNPATGRPFPDTDISFTGYRIGMPFFLPVQAHDSRVQLLDNLSFVQGAHFIKLGGEWNRTNVNQTFVGFGNGRMAFSSVDGFLNYVQFGNQYVECSDGSNSTSGSCPAGTTITGPVILYLQQAGVGGRTVEEAGTQSIIQNELALFLQDSWKPRRNVTLDYGLRWEAQIEPAPITPASEVFFAPFIGQTVTNATGTYAFPSNGEIPSDWKMFQPRFGFAWDVAGNGRSVVRASAGLYYARIPGLNLASTRSTNGSIGQTLFRNSELTGILGAPPAYGELLPTPSGAPFQPGVFVFDQNFQNPRTFSATAGFDREVAPGLALSLSYTHARTDHLTRFIDRNDAVFGKPWATGLGTDGSNGVGTLTVVESSAKSRYNGVTLGARRTLNRNLQFQANYTLSWDKADDDNERDPFSFRYAKANDLTPEYNWSDRDQRHRLNLWLLARLPGDLYLNNRVSAYSAQPTSEKCGTDSRPTGVRAVTPQDRICPDGTILKRNTIRKDNAYFSWDVRFSRPFNMKGQRRMEVIAEVFNLLNHDNFKDPAAGSLFLNFDGTIHTGLGEPRQAQVGLRYLF